MTFRKNRFPERDPSKQGYYSVRTTRSQLSTVKNAVVTVLSIIVVGSSVRDTRFLFAAVARSIVSVDFGSNQKFDRDRVVTSVPVAARSRSTTRYSDPRIHRPLHRWLTDFRTYLYCTSTNNYFFCNSVLYGVVFRRVFSFCGVTRALFCTVDNASVGLILVKLPWSENKIEKEQRRLTRRAREPIHVEPI